MIIRLNDYKLGNKVASLALDEDTFRHLAQKQLNIMYLINCKLYFYPDNQWLELTDEQAALFKQCDNYDVFQINGIGQAYKYYDNEIGDNAFMVTEQCNSNCIMCPATDNMRRKKNTVNVDEILEIGFIYILIESIALWLINDKGKWSSDFLEAFKHTLFQYIKAMIYISALSHIYNYFIFPHVRIPNVVMSIAFILFFWKIRSFEFYNSLPLAVFIAVFDLGMTIFTGTVTVSTNWITYVIVLTFMLLRLFVSKYNYQIINTEDIKRGMILSQVSSLLMQNSRIEGMPSVSDESLDSRLTIEEAESIVRWSKTKNGLKQITIVRKIPFPIVPYFSSKSNPHI